jgi:hypothetical protein
MSTVRTVQPVASRLGANAPVGPRTRSLRPNISTRGILEPSVASILKSRGFEMRLLRWRTMCTSPYADDVPAQPPPPAPGRRVNEISRTDVSI